jgi:hypothetical protein
MTRYVIVVFKNILNEICYIFYVYPTFLSIRSTIQWSVIKWFLILRISFVHEAEVFRDKIFTKLERKKICLLCKEIIID